MKLLRRCGAAPMTQEHRPGLRRRRAMRRRRMRLPVMGRPATHRSVIRRPATPRPVMPRPSTPSVRRRPFPRSRDLPEHPPGATRRGPLDLLIHPRLRIPGPEPAAQPLQRRRGISLGFANGWPSAGTAAVPRISHPTSQGPVNGPLPPLLRLRARPVPDPPLRQTAPQAVPRRPPPPRSKTSPATTTSKSSTRECSAAEPSNASSTARSWRSSD